VLPKTCLKFLIVLIGTIEKKIDLKKKHGWTSKYNGVKIQPVSSPFTRVNKFTFNEGY
jgi:hypothetical protein